MEVDHSSLNLIHFIFSNISVRVTRQKDLALSQRTTRGLFLGK